MDPTIHSPLSAPTWLPPPSHDARPGWPSPLPTLPVCAEPPPASPEPRYCQFPQPRALGSPCPIQPLTALLSLLEPTPLASGPSLFQRAGSVRDRVRKFTSDSPMAAGLQEGPLRAALGPSTPARLPGSSHISTTPASSSRGPSSRGPSDTSSQFNKDRSIINSSFLSSSSHLLTWSNQAHSLPSSKLLPLFHLFDPCKIPASLAIHSTGHTFVTEIICY